MKRNIDIVAVLGVVAFAVYAGHLLKPEQEGHRDMRPIQGTVECEIAKGRYLDGPITFEVGVHRTIAEKVKDVCRGTEP